MLNDLILEFRALASQLDKIDQDVYQTYQKDPLEPIIGMGPATANLCIFGRDPGRLEVEFQVPFIGAGGQKVRQELFLARYGAEMPTFKNSKKESLSIGETVFWANTVPYKPIGNKAWSEKVKKQFAPIMQQVLVNYFKGDKIMTLGREAFLWFGLLKEKEEKARLLDFWTSQTRFHSSIPVEIQTADHLARTFHLYPLPHPSPLNATWFKKFPDLLKQRLSQVGYGSKKGES